MKPNHIQNERLRLIVRFLDRGGGSLAEMMQQVNHGLSMKGLNQIRIRTLQYCIEVLRKGKFDHALSHLPVTEKQLLFKISFFNRKYSWHPDTQKPIFGDLEKDERFSLPFLRGLLKQYESIPAVEKILSQLPEIFNVTEAEMKSSTAIFHSGPKIDSDFINNLEEKVIKCVTKILEHIHHQQVIEFNYFTVDKVEQHVSEKNLKKVKPLAIKLYEHYYYLFAEDYVTGWLNNFRIDQIINLKVDILTDEHDAEVRFNHAELHKKHNLEEKLRYSLGVWTFKDNSNLHEFHIEFTEWAANYIKNIKFHDTQKLIKEKDDIIVISFTLNLNLPNGVSPFDIEKSCRELAFLLGRFRSFCKIIKIEKK